MRAYHFNSKSKLSECIAKLREGATAAAAAAVAAEPPLPEKYYST